MSESSSEDDDEIQANPPDENLVSSNRDDAISVISNANSENNNKSKKRVQFLPDGILVKIREIPPRCNKSSSESDGSTSETDSNSDSDSDSENTESASDRETPSPVSVQTVSDTTFTTMPPLVWNPPVDNPEKLSQAKGSYSISKPSSRGTSVVAKITGIHRPVSPCSTSKAANKKSKRTPSPKPEKRSRKPPVRQCERSTPGRISPEDSKKQKPQKKKPPPKTPGKVSPTVSVRQSKSIPPPRASIPARPSHGLPSRRVNSAPLQKLSSSTQRLSHSTTVSTSLTVLPIANTQSLDLNVDRVGRAMQSLNVGKLYTLDGFIFPTHQVSTNIHLPELHSASRPEEDFLYVNGRRGSADTPTNVVTSPRRDVTSCKTPLSPTSATRKRRYAWQMANGSIPPHNNPSITQMWDSAPLTSSATPFTTQDVYPQHVGKPFQGHYSRGKS